MNTDLIKKTRLTSSILISIIKEYDRNHFIKSNENLQDDSRRSSSGSKSVVCQNRRADRCYRMKNRSATVARDARTMIWIIADEERLSVKEGSTTVKEGSTTTEKVFEEVTGGVEWWGSTRWRSVSRKRKIEYYERSFDKNEKSVKVDKDRESSTIVSTYAVHCRILQIRRDGTRQNWITEQSQSKLKFSNSLCIVKVWDSQR